MKYIVCYSGGHSSALVAIEAVRKVGKENVVLLNHDISPKVENADIKRFKKEVADYLGLPITYANMENWENMTPLKIAKDKKAFKYGHDKVLCTYNLKTEPFAKWLKENCPSKPFEIREDITILYGFDKEEPERITRKVGILASMGYKVEFPLAYWERTIEKTEDIGIQRPKTYEIYKHANCIGCLKAGRQHWYIVYCLNPEIFEEAKETEEIVGYTIIKGISMKGLEPKFRKMKEAGIIPSEKMKAQTFWAKVRKQLPEEDNILPCDCAS